MKEILIDTAKKAGKLLLDNFRNEEFSQIAVDKGRFDYSIKMDKMAEDLIVSLLRENGIKGKIVAEETGEISLGASDYTLYIDPLDGTFNYAHGIPHYAVSIGVEKNGEIVLGTTYDPNTDELFFAERGKGAFLNGKKIQVSKTGEMGYAIVNLFSRTLKYHPELAKAYVELFKSAYIRMPMSAVLALAYTACGRTDVTVGSGHNEWDVAAGVLLVREAGGKVTDVKGDDFNLESPVIVATNNFIHGKILEKLMV
jgi:myo-inositol-1(or 4)-monophosphatase